MNGFPEALAEVLRHRMGAGRRHLSFEPSAPQDPKPVLALIEAAEEEVRARLDSGVPLLD